MVTDSLNSSMGLKNVCYIFFTGKMAVIPKIANNVAGLLSMFEMLNIWACDCVRILCSNRALRSVSLTAMF